MNDTTQAGRVWTPTTPLIVGGRTVFCKHEYLNPSGSTKDRIARAMLDAGAEAGLVAEGGWVVEASSGSTAIALALFAARRGLRFAAVMPEGVSKERVATLAALGAEVVLTSCDDGMGGCIQRAQAIVEERGAFWPRQFENPVNEEAHRRETACEMLEALPGGRADAVVSGVGTGGTLLGLYLGCCDACEGGDAARPVPVLARPVDRQGELSGNACFGDVGCFSCRIPGVIDGMSRLFRPERLPGLLVLDVCDQRALEVTRWMIRQGLPVGPSSGLNVCAAVDVAERLGGDAVVATVLPDRMERYLSTGLLDCAADRGC